MMTGSFYPVVENWEEDVYYQGNSNLKFGSVQLSKNTDYNNYEIQEDTEKETTFVKKKKLPSPKSKTRQRKPGTKFSQHFGQDKEEKEEKKEIKLFPSTLPSFSQDKKKREETC